MKLPDGTELMHKGRPYDAAKAHAYYMRVRKLKGRKKGAGVVTNVRPKGKPGANKLVAKRKKPKATPKQRAEARQRIMDLTKRLADLNAALKERMSEKKSTARKSKAEAKTAAKKAQQKPSKKELAEKARDAKKYADKNKQTLKTKAKTASAGGGSSGKPSALSTSKKAGVADLEKKVEATKNELNAAIAKYRALG